MKKKMKTKPRIFGLFLFLLGCLLATGHALAGNPTTLTVGGTDVLSGGYWTTNADGASESDYNVKYDKDSNTLTLNGGITSGTSSTHRGAVVGGTAANIGGGQADNLYFGTYQQSSGGNGGYNIDPIKWRVLENADGQLFLISDQNLDVFQYHTDWEEITWERSTMRSWLNGYGASENAGGDSGTDYTSDNFIGTAFSEKEQKAIAETTVVNDDNPNHNTDGGNNTTDKIFLLSIAEANNGSYFADESSRISTNTAYVASGGKIGGDMYSAGKGDWWWLRSPGGDDHSAAGVAGNGDVDNAGVHGDDEDRAVRPAFHLDLNSVLFTSAAAGGKSASGMDSGLTAVGDYDGNEWKLTLLDNSRSFSVTETTVSGDRGTTVTLHYSGATNGTNEYISVLLTDEQGNALYYGRVAEPNSAEGEVSLTIPDALAAGTYTLNVFSEQYNGDYQTDYASAFEAVTLTVSATPEQINGVYQIKTANNLFWFAALVNGTLTDGTAQNAAACAVLTTNIDLTGEAWTPIGNESNPYTGTFDGQNHTISGMTLENATGYSGLFGNVTGTVRDFTVTGSITINTTATDLKVGGAVGCLGTASASGTVSGVTSGVDITVTSGKGHIGGVVGSMMEDSEPTVESCLYTGNITGSADADCVAGVVGYIRSGTIQNCANQGTVTVNGTGGSVGGILGYGNNAEIYIRNCYNTGTVTGKNKVGAIVGQNNNNQFLELTNCYYLTGSADKGQGQLVTDAAGTVVKSEDDFNRGAVAVLLQGSQTVQVWGQTLGMDDYPVLTTEEAKKVYTYNIYKGSNVAEAGYANSGNAIGLEGNAVAVVETDGFTAADDNANVIVKNGDGAYTCANLELTDGADFYTPVAFTATEAIYSRTLPESSTWGTIVLPFAAETIERASLYEATEIIADGSEESILAVQPLTDGVLEANTPALFQGKTSGTTVTFSASEAEVAATADADLTKTIGESGYTLTGSLSTINPLATGDLFIAKDLFWSVGTENTVGMQAFRAYIDAPKAGPEQVNALRILVGDATSIRQALSDGTLPVDVYNLQGVQLRKNVARDAALEGLPAGIYIVGGKKVVKK